VAEHTGIEWTDATWNPLVGCTKVSPGCDHCYAETLVNRFAGTSKAFPNRFDVVTIRDERMLAQPLRWRRPRRIFVNSLSDLFHADVPDDFIARVFAVMALAPQHTFQLLTKRHARMRSLLKSEGFEPLVRDIAWNMKYAGERSDPRMNDQNYRTWPLPNVWLGVSVEDQHWADIRIPALLDTPAAVRWISAEPLLGPVRLDGEVEETLAFADEGGALPMIAGLDWVVVGGESGRGARPMHPDWLRDLRDECYVAKVPFLFKQWGHWAPHRTPRMTITQTTSFSMAEDGSAVSWRDRSGTELWPLGKKAAGRELDGRTYDGYPEARHG
jgi:protein gp37